MPFIRCVGESWKCSIERTRFEGLALEWQATVSPQVPRIFHRDDPMALYVMEYLQDYHVLRDRTSSRP